MEGNTLIDCSTEVKHGHRCAHCNGTGYHEWEMTAFTDALDMKVYRRKKSGNPVTEFKELMKIARIIKEEGQPCDACDATGEAYND